MEKSRSRHSPKQHPLIIDRPDLQAWPQRALSGALTTFFWLAWLVLWIPLLTLGGWFFFGWQFKFHMFDLGGLTGYAELISLYMAVIVAMGAVLLGWAKYNHLRFRNVERRKAFPLVTPAGVGARTGHSEAEVLAWRKMQVMVVEHDEHGGIIAVTDKAAASQPFVPLPVAPARREEHAVLEAA